MTSLGEARLHKTLATKICRPMGPVTSTGMTLRVWIGCASHCCHPRARREDPSLRKCDGLWMGRGSTSQHPPGLAAPWVLGTSPRMTPRGVARTLPQVTRARLLQHPPGEAEEVDDRVFAD